MEAAATVIEIVVKATVADLASVSARISAIVIMIATITMDHSGIANGVITRADILLNTTGVAQEVRSVTGGIRLQTKYRPGLVMKTPNADVGRTGCTKAVGLRIINAPMNESRKISMTA
jgi:hypothetical protein